VAAWLIILLIGVVLLILGITGLGQVFLWIGIAVLVIGLIFALVGRGRSRT